MEKREWIFLGFLGSIIGLLVWLLVNVAFGTYSVTTPLFAFVYSLAYFEFKYFYRYYNNNYNFCNLYY